MKRILLIIPYFGRLPAIWSFYLDSLKRNPLLHLLFITDNIINEKLPGNISILQFSLHEFYQFVEDKLKLSIPESAKRSYKICELKPTFGYLFSDYLKDYEYWAFGDIDLIYGHLPRFLKQPFEENADVISFREDWISGAFTVVKNCKLLNELFFQSPDFYDILKNPVYQFFDECGKKFEYLKYGMSPDEAYKLNIENDILCWTTLVHRLAEKKQINLFIRHYIKESLPHGEIIEFRNGRIVGAEYGVHLLEYAIYHFLHYKNSYSHVIPSWQEIPDFYHISLTGIYAQNQMKCYYWINKFRYFRGSLMKLNLMIWQLR